MNNWNLIEQQQKTVCERFKINFSPVEYGALIAINESLFSSIAPINGLRHPNHGKFEGWYLWRGFEIPQEDDNFFKPLHVEHLIEQQPLVLKYLGLPAGWRFQIDERGYEDIWFDNSLLTI